MDQRHILLHTLELIDYKDDKETFIANFVDQAKQDAFLTLVTKLPKEKQIQILQNYAHPTEDDVKQGVLGKYFSQEEINKAIVFSVQKSFYDLIKTALPYISKTQKKELYTFLKPFTKVKRKN